MYNTARGEVKALADASVYYGSLFWHSLWENTHKKNSGQITIKKTWNTKKEKKKKFQNSWNKKNE